MSNHYEDTYPLSGSMDKKRNYIIKTLESLKWNYFQVSDNEFLVKLGLNVASWGEKVSITFNEKNIYIRSKSSFGLTMADWGKNKENVVHFMKELKHIIDSEHFYKNDKADKKIKENHNTDKNFVNKVLSSYHLFENQLLSKEEFSKRKSQIIDEFRGSISDINPEDFLLSLLPLREKGIIEDEDLNFLKSILYGKIN